jgi:hypothetical protein
MASTPTIIDSYIKLAGQLGNRATKARILTQDIRTPKLLTEIITPNSNTGRK